MVCLWIVEVLSHYHIVEGIVRKELVLRLYELRDVFRFKAYVYLYILRVLLPEIGKGAEIPFHLCGSHTYIRHVTVREHPRTVIRKAQYLYPRRNSALHEFSVCAPGMAAAGGMGVIIGKHRLSPFLKLPPLIRPRCRSVSA